MSFEEHLAAHTKALNEHTTALNAHAKVMLTHGTTINTGKVETANKEPAKVETPAKTETAKPADVKPAEPAKVDAGKKLTVDDVRAALRAVANKQGRDAAKELLTKRGVEAVADLKETDYALVIADADALAKEDF